MSPTPSPPVPFFHGKGLKSRTWFTKRDHGHGDDDSEAQQRRIIAGSVVGGIVLLVMIGLIIYFVRRHRSQARPRNRRSVQLIEDDEGDTSNPRIPQNTQADPFVVPMSPVSQVSASAPSASHNVIASRSGPSSGAVKSRVLRPVNADIEHGTGPSASDKTREREQEQPPAYTSIETGELP